MAPWVASLMPEHATYLEPFSGSAAVLFAKTPCKDEVINDVDDDVVNFFTVLREHGDELERRCALSPYARAEYIDACVNPRPGDDPIEWARRYWVRSTQAFGQSAGADFGWSISIRENTCRPASLRNRLDRFGAAANRLASVFIENCNALDLLARYDGPRTVAYVDPPYLWSTRTSFNDAKGYRRRPKGDYAHEFHTDEQHTALADVLRSLDATVLLSGYASDLYDRELYTDWWRVERIASLHMSNGRGVKGRRAQRTEVIWSNRPINEGRLFDGSVAAAT